jgi:hypothetical protein
MIELAFGFNVLNGAKRVERLERFERAAAVMAQQRETATDYVAEAKTCDRPLSPQKPDKLAANV